MKSSPLLEKMDVLECMLSLCSGRPSTKPDDFRAASEWEYEGIQSTALQNIPAFDIDIDSFALDFGLSSPNDNYDFRQNLENEEQLLIALDGLCWR